MDAAAFERVYGAFQDFHAYFAPLFGRRETRDHSRHCLQALLVQSGERRNAENLSESVGVSARAMQRFLTESPWDEDTVIGLLQEYLGPRLEHPEAVWVLDGSDFPKQGCSRWEWPGSTAVTADIKMRKIAAVVQRFYPNKWKAKTFGRLFGNGLDLRRLNSLARSGALSLLVGGLSA